MFAIIKANFNSQITNRLLEGCEKYLKKEGFDFEVFEVPGAWEIPQLAGKLLRSKKYDGIIALGCIIRGDTYHFEIIANESARGLMNLSINNDVPVINGILACDTHEQAEKRSKGQNNKGVDCAKAVIEIVNLDS